MEFSTSDSNHVSEQKETVTMATTDVSVKVEKTDGSIVASQVGTCISGQDLHKSTESKEVKTESGETTERPGFARLKKEFIKVDYKPQLDEKFLSKDTKDQLAEGKKRQQEDTNEKNEPPRKKVKLKGRNKQRPVTLIDHKNKLCPTIFQEKDCSFGSSCKFSHDVATFMKNKPPDIGPSCFMFETYGKCPYGVACRFGGKHISEDNKNIVNKELYAVKSKEKPVSNILSKDLQKDLWKKRYNFEKANENVKKIQKMAQEKHNTFANKCANRQDGKEATKEPEGCVETPATNCSPDISVDSSSPIKLRPQEKKKIDFTHKLYLAPLTTVGNLPFRRICKQYGADVTCSEMAMSTNLLNGQTSEWALLKRHESEDLFGVQICGGFLDTLTRTSQLINEKVDLDFLDLNCGCPIDLVYKKGEGCALIGRLNKFETIIHGMKSVLDVPLTVKMRTGIFDNKNIAHTVIPKLRDWGVSMVTLHGRSREQRYTRLADWQYIDECAQASAPMPVFVTELFKERLLNVCVDDCGANSMGNGDILSYEDLQEHLKKTNVNGCMMARGALIKPWIFTEIKERRHWDISSSERFDMLRKFVNNGLEHWGCDQQGVETTRRFLLEWLSFLYRYIPVGILERVPQKINERPPFYTGRDDLETLMASPNCGDWIKLSEMLLGPVPEGYNFLPKHKANAYK